MKPTHWNPLLREMSIHTPHLLEDLPGRLVVSKALKSLPTPGATASLWPIAEQIGERGQDTKRVTWLPYNGTNLSILEHD